MWTTAAKLLMFFLLRNRFNETKNQIKDDIHKVKDSIADLAESRAVIFKLNFNAELGRLARSFLGFMLMLIAITCSGITAIIWLAAIALNSPHRNLIFSGMIIVPLIAGLVIYFVIRYSWEKESLFHQSIAQIERDWRLFRDADGTKNSISEINSTEETT